MANEFLDQFEANRRSVIANQFCFAVRDGASTVEEVIEKVSESAYKRLLFQSCCPQTDAQRQLIAALDTGEARKYARFIIEREGLPRVERQKQKEEQAVNYQREYMATQPPTEKQLSYLKILGVSEVPENRLEASDLIEEAKTRKAYGNLQRQEY